MGFKYESKYLSNFISEDFYEVTMLIFYFIIVTLKIFV